MPKLSPLQQNFLEHVKKPPLKRKLLPYQSYLRKHKQYTSLIYSLISYKREVPLEQSHIIDKIIHDCSKIYEALLPLYQIGVHFSLALAGGAIRDVLLGKEHQIKDLDIVLSIRMPDVGLTTQSKYSWKKNKKINYVSFTALKDPNLHKLLYEKLEFNVFEHAWFSKHTSDQLKVYEIIKFLLGKKHTYEKCYPPFKIHQPQQNSEIISDFPEYSQSLLNGVLKINTPGLNYPVDILITSASISDYINKFDFNICKASILLVEQEKTKLEKFDFPENPETFLSKYVPCHEFLEDVKHKKITMDLTFRSVKDVINSIENHLVRIENKYSDYDVVFPLDHADIINKEDKETIVRHYFLSKHIKAPTEDEFANMPTRAKI